MLLLYEISVSVDLEVEEAFQAFIQSHAALVGKIPNFSVARVYLRDPTHPVPLNGKDADAPKADRMHRYYTVYYEVEDVYSLQAWIEQEEPKFAADLQKLTNGNPELIKVTSRKVQYPLESWHTVERSDQLP
ncbi:hypothetical protein BZG36_04439 [Bifiguratus adelaidae]|uniref:EthD domain-containing protein n=1 Tax=Bifiguratus adelaidae TaxID=1938954 RepID=A0A261XVK8_9FUNG|nr:hypothetical protein BZG36_04439 [Bifiguratus adelaidae]